MAGFFMALYVSVFFALVALALQAEFEMNDIHHAEAECLAAMKRMEQSTWRAKASIRKAKRIWAKR